MSTKIREEAEEVAKMVDELNAVVLPDPSADLVPLPQADAPTAEEITKRMAEIDMGDTNSIVTFGSNAQAELQADQPGDAAGVKNKDVGPAGDSCARSSARSAASRSTSSTPTASAAGGNGCSGRAAPMA
jgi:uncharacterized protein YaaN involved in tellurite resistance